MNCLQPPGAGRTVLLFFFYPRRKRAIDAARSMDRPLFRLAPSADVRLAVPAVVVDRCVVLLGYFLVGLSIFLALRVVGKP